MDTHKKDPGPPLAETAKSNARAPSLESRGQEAAMSDSAALAQSLTAKAGFPAGVQPSALRFYGHCLIACRNTFSLDCGDIQMYIYIYIHAFMYVYIYMYIPTNRFVDVNGIWGYFTC